MLSFSCFGIFTPSEIFTMINHHGSSRRRRGRPRKSSTHAEDVEAIAAHREQNERKVQLESWRRRQDQVNGEGNYNNPQLLGGIDWSSIEFTHPSYKHIKRKQQYNSDMNIQPHQVTQSNKRQRVMGDEGSSGSSSGSSSSSSSSSTTTTTTTTPPTATPPLVVQLNPTMAESEQAREKLEIEYLASGGLGDLKPVHLLIRRYIAENSPEVIVAHADRVARKATSLVLTYFPPKSATTNVFTVDGLTNPHAEDDVEEEEEEEEEEDEEDEEEEDEEDEEDEEENDEDEEVDDEKRVEEQDEEEQVVE